MSKYRDNPLGEPIFFSPKPTKFSRTLYKGGGGGDGGAADRKKKEDKRVADAVQKVNEIFGLAEATPEVIDKKNYTKNVPVKSVSLYNSNNPAYTSQGQQQNGMADYALSQQARTKKVFDEEKYNAAVTEAQAKADSLKGAAQARETLYSTIGTDSTNNALVDLNKERGIAERDLGFMLARNGLSGGSRDIDANKDVLDTYQQGVLKASNIGLSTANTARSNDDTTRVNLINSIRSGLDQDSAMQQSYEGMKTNAANARDDANTASLAGFFDVLRAQQQQQQYQQGVANATQQYKSPYTTNTMNGDKGITRSY